MSDMTAIVQPIITMTATHAPVVEMTATVWLFVPSGGELTGQPMGLLLALTYA